MALQAERALPDGDGLNRATGRGGEHLGTVRRPAHLGAMPLQEAAALRQAREQRVSGGAGAQLDLEHPDLRRGGRPDLAAQRIREQLMAEADAEERHGARQHRLANRGLLIGQPGVLRLLPDVLGPAHDPERVESAQIRNLLAEIEPHRVRGDVVLLQECPEDARVTRFHVLKDENAWHAHRALLRDPAPLAAMLRLIALAGAKGEGTDE